MSSMTKLKPQETPFNYAQIEDITVPGSKWWVTNPLHFSIHLNDEVVISNKHGALKKVRLIRRTNIKPLKGSPLWRIVATANQFPVAENEQVIACNHVAPAPDSKALIVEGLNNTIDLINSIKDRVNG